MRKEPHAPFCVCCFLFYFPICPFWGGREDRLQSERLFRGARGEKETQMPSLFLCLSPSLHLIKNALLPVSVLFFCFFLVSYFSLLCFFLPHTHTHAMVKLQSRRPQEATFPLPIEKKKCEGSAQMDLFIPVTVVTEAQTLCDDQGNKIEPHFGPTWPMDRLV